MSENKKDKVAAVQAEQVDAAEELRALAQQQLAPVPLLTLEPQAADKLQMDAVITQLEAANAKEPAAPDVQAAIAKQLDSSLTEAERKSVDDFSRRIDIANPQHVMLYGADAQKKVSDFADTVLADVKNKDSGNVGDMMTKLIGELESFETSTEKPKGIRGWFFSAEKYVAQVRSRFDTVSRNVETIATALEQHQVQLLKDVAMFNHLYDMNIQYFKELTMYIIAGEKRLAAFRADELVKAQEKAKASGDAMDAQKASDLAQAGDRFEKKLHDLKLTRQISMQMAPQIRLLQNNNALLIERIQSTLVNTLPLWKNQMVLAIGMEHSRQAMEAQRAVTNMTNELLTKNAESLKMGTVETAKEAERGIIDIDTLIKTNQSLIDTMNEVVKIQQEGRQKRRDAEKSLLQMETELKNRLING
ncbi:MAG: toxic anion resistance protein [Christensenellales bacterium]